MSRWRIRYRRGCTCIWPPPPEPRASQRCRAAPMSAWRARSSPALAESLTYKAQGYSVIGMTNMPEAKLAREAEICYASVAMVTDFDCWHPDHDAVTVQDIIRVLNSNADKAKALVARLARDFPREHEPCPVGSDTALDTALITAPEARDPRVTEEARRRRRAGVAAMKVDGRHFRSIWLEHDGWSVGAIDQRRLPHEFVIARAGDRRRGSGRDPQHAGARRAADRRHRRLRHGAGRAGRSFRRRPRSRLRTADRDAADRDQSEMGARRDAARARPLAPSERLQAAYARAAEIAEEDVAINRRDRPARPRR